MQHDEFIHRCTGADLAVAVTQADEARVQQLLDELPVSQMREVGAALCEARVPRIAQMLIKKIIECDGQMQDSTGCVEYANCYLGGALINAAKKGLSAELVEGVIEMIDVPRWTPYFGLEAQIETALRATHQPEVTRHLTKLLEKCKRCTRRHARADRAREDQSHDGIRKTTSLSG